MSLGALEARPGARPAAGAVVRSWRRALRQRWLYAMLAPVIIYYLVFSYVPMYGAVIAFKDYRPFLGVAGSPWVGWENFERFFSSIYFWRLVRNTIFLNVFSLLVGFPAPILLALMLNELARPLFKRLVQTFSYLPYFVSTVIIAGMILSLLSPTTGPVNRLLSLVGASPIPFMSQPGWFRPVYVLSGVWQYVGWNSIIYLAGLAAIDPALYDSAEVDGAGRWAKMRHISLPGVAPIAMVLLLLQLGNLLNVGFEKAYLLQNPATYETSDVISTYVYRAGLAANDFSFGAAVGLFNSVVSLVLLALFNGLAGRLGQQRLW